MGDSMKKTKKIGWQKYEDVIENQLNSPVANHLINSFLGGVFPESNLPIPEHDHEHDHEDEHLIQDQFTIAIPETLSNEISLLTNFDCWVGHTNFNITEDIKKQMNRIEGIEVLKICSRYRFFIGIGKMFSFKEVRKNIEDQLITRKTNG